MSTAGNRVKAVKAPKLSETNTNPVNQHAPILKGVDTILHYKNYKVGESYYGSERWVEYIAGNLPIIVTCPHGGYDNPEHVPDRKHGVHEPDINTQELVRLIPSAFQRVLGLPNNVSPHIVINRLRRAKLDMNRNEQDASGGNVETKKTWNEFQAFVRRAKREIVRGRSLTNPKFHSASENNSAAATSLVNLAAGSPVSPSSSASPGAAVTPAPGSPSTSSPGSSSSSSSTWYRGLCFDLHGQSHDVRHQLGYVLNQKELSALRDAVLDCSKEMVEKCSLRNLIDAPPDAAASTPSPPADTNASVSSNNNGSSRLSTPTCFGSLRPGSPTLLSEIIRGKKSFGYLLESRGTLCVPSESSPHAGEIMYFNGGYNSYVNGSSIIGAAQRLKERDARKAERLQLQQQQQHLPSSAEGGSGAEGANNFPMKVLDPDTSFTELFDRSLEEEYFAGIQLESAYGGSRDSEDNRQQFAVRLAESMVQFCKWHILNPNLEEQFPTPASSSSSNHSAATSDKLRNVQL